MTPDLEEPNTSLGLTPLIKGIVNDAQQLIGQQLSMFKAEIRNDLGRTKDAAIPLTVGMVVSLLAVIFLGLTSAHLIVWLWPQCPMFAAYGAVTAVLGVAGGILVFMGKSRFDAFNPLPDKSLDALKENIQWTTKT